MSVERVRQAIAVGQVVAVAGTPESNRRTLHPRRPWRRRQTKAQFGYRPKNVYIVQRSQVPGFACLFYQYLSSRITFLPMSDGQYLIFFFFNRMTSTDRPPTQDPSAHGLMFFFATFNHRFYKRGHKSCKNGLVSCWAHPHRQGRYYLVSWDPSWARQLWLPRMWSHSKEYFKRRHRVTELTTP